MATCRVYNDDDKEYVEEFKGDTIRIPAKGYVTMDFMDGHQFNGQAISIRRLDNGLPLTCKRLRVVNDTKAGKVSDSGFICQKCGVKHPSQKDLDGHISAMHLDEMVNEDAKRAFKKRA